jgi:hypothetical protein
LRGPSFENAQTEFENFPGERKRVTALFANIKGSAELNKDGGAPLSTRRRPFMTGTAEHVAADLETLARLGYSHCTLHLDVRSRTIAEFVDMMAEFGERVLPLVGNFEASAF